MLVLEHVAQVLGAREAEAAIHVERHRLVVDGLAQRVAERGRHLLAGELLARDADRLADVGVAPLEDAVGALADVFGRDPREFGVPHRQRISRRCRSGSPKFVRGHRDRDA